MYTAFDELWPPNKSTFIARLSNGGWGKFWKPCHGKDKSISEAREEFRTMIKTYGMVDWMIPEPVTT